MVYLDFTLLDSEKDDLSLEIKVVKYIQEDKIFIKRLILKKKCEITKRIFPLKDVDKQINLYYKKLSRFY